MTAAVTPSREALAQIIDPGAFCTIGARPNPITEDRQRSALSKADENFVGLAAKPADEVREEAAYAAYLGICVLATMSKKAGLFLAEKRATELLIEMGTAFPEFAGRSALRASTTGEPKR